jgi:2-deoxystreptamine N-acetyl-D-glucosaminyltransferase/2-deoxystreptamine glucosyltransferase
VALLEAMAAGLPVVATDVGDAPHVVAGAHTSGPAGLLTPTGFPEALAQGIVTLLRDPERCAVMGAAGAARVAADYGAAAWAGRMLDLYAELAHAEPGAIR